MALTVKDIKRRIEGMPEDAQVYAYIGHDGLRVQAEWPSESDATPEPGYGTILEAPTLVPSCGGPVS